MDVFLVEQAACSLSLASCWDICVWNRSQQWISNGLLTVNKYFWVVILWCHTVACSNILPELPHTSLPVSNIAMGEFLVMLQKLLLVFYIGTFKLCRHLMVDPM